MSLLISPIDGSPMRQIRRYGIEIDVCPTTGGVWLDKGELEKLITLLKEEARNDSFSGARSVYEDHNSHFDYDDDQRGYHEKGHRHRQKNKMSRIMDIFDF